MAARSVASVRDSDHNKSNFIKHICQSFAARHRVIEGGIQNPLVVLESRRMVHLPPARSQIMTKSQEIPSDDRAVLHPAKPVIRELRMVEEDARVIWTRRIRAFLVSGVAHTVLITAFIVVCRAFAGTGALQKAKVTTNTIIEMAEEIPQAQDEFKMDFDLDSSLVWVEPVPADDFPIEAKVIEGETLGLPEHNEEFAAPSSNPGVFSSLLPDSTSSPKDEIIGLPSRGRAGGGSETNRFGLKGNSGLPPAVQNRLDKAGGKTGQVQITLVWNNRNDLDLHCIDPNGEEIFYGHIKAVLGSGGHLDVDRNVSGETEKPIENIYFPQGRAPAGKYRVYVDHFNNNGSRDPTYFKVYIKVDDRRAEYSGVISEGQPMRLIRELILPPPQK